MKQEIIDELSIGSDNFAPREAGPKGFNPPGEKTPDPTDRKFKAKVKGKSHRF